MLKRFGITALAAGFVAAALAAPAYAQTNEEKEKKIAALAVEKLGDDAKSVRVTVVGEKATLTGEVAEKATMELSKEVALAVPGIKKVDNQLKASKASGIGGKLGGEMHDSKLETKVNSKLSDDVGKSASKAIEVEAVDGVVSLRGSLPDAERKAMALKSATSVEGVKKVIDLISVAGK